MKTTMKLLLIICAVALTACASKPIPLATAQLAPQERIIYRAQKGAKTANVTFVRDIEVSVMMPFVRIAMDGEVVALIDKGEKTTIALPEGDHVFGVFAHGTATGYGHTKSSIDQRLEAGKTYFYRVYFDGENAFMIKRVIGEDYK